MRRTLTLPVTLLAAASRAVAAPLLVSPTPNDDGLGVGGYAWTTMTADLTAAAGGTPPTAVDLSTAPLTAYDGLWVDVRNPDPDPGDSADDALSPAEASALSAYIATGRRVVLVGSNSAYSTWNNSILSLVGGTDGGGLAAGTYSAVAVVPLTAGVPGLYARAGDVAVGGTTLFSQRVATVWGPARNVLVLLNTIAIGDDDVGKSGNAAFANNLARWAAGTLADPAVLWAATAGGNWQDGSSWLAGAMPAVADDVVFSTGATDTARLAGPVTARTLTVQSDRLTLDLATATAGLTVGSTLAVTAGASLALTHSAGGGTAAVSAATATVNGTLVVGSGSGLAVAGATTTAAGSNLAVLAGGSLTTASLSAAGSTSVLGHLVLAAPSRLGVLGLASGTGQLDVTTAAVVVAGGDLPTLTAAAATGFDGGRWDGPGLASSAAAADPARLTAVGVIANGTAGGTPLYTTFDGRPTAAGDVLVRYTAYGDADLNGVVNAADYARIDNGFVNRLTGWANGDFNYDGVVDGSDYTLIDNAFDRQAKAAAAAEVAAGVTAVPEPVGMAMAAVLAGGSLLCRRQRRRSRALRRRHSSFGFRP